MLFYKTFYKKCFERVKKIENMILIVSEVEYNFHGHPSSFNCQCASSYKLQAELDLIFTHYEFENVESINKFNFKKCY